MINENKILFYYTDRWCIILIMGNYKSGANIVCSCKYHIVWCPKYRRPVLNGEIAARLKSILKAIASKKDAEIIEMQIMPDHVHLLIKQAPQFGIHKLVKLLKGRSSRILRQEFPELKRRLPTLWTNSYFISTVGGAPLATIKRYIENQKNV